MRDCGNRYRLLFNPNSSKLLYVFSTLRTGFLVAWSLMGTSLDRGGLSARRPKPWEFPAKEKPNELPPPTIYQQQRVYLLSILRQPAFTALKAGEQEKRPTSTARFSCHVDLGKLLVELNRPPPKLLLLLHNV